MAVIIPWSFYCNNNLNNETLVLYLFFFQVILTVAEHHSAIVPWQIVAQRTGAILKFVTLNENDVPDMQNFKEIFSKNTKLVVVHHISNVLGEFSAFASFWHMLTISGHFPFLIL